MSYGPNTNFMYGCWVEDEELLAPDDEIFVENVFEHPNETICSQIIEWWEEEGWGSSGIGVLRDADWFGRGVMFVGIILPREFNDLDEVTVKKNKSMSLLDDFILRMTGKKKDYHYEILTRMW